MDAHGAVSAMTVIRPENSEPSITPPRVAIVDAESDDSLGRATAQETPPKTDVPTSAARGGAHHHPRLPT